MDSVLLLPMLAYIPDGSGYISLPKVGIVVVLLFLWALAAQWVDRDTNVVKTKREHWNMIVLVGGFVGFFVLFTVPWPGVLFGVGIAFWAILAGGALVLYVLHRNGRVVPSARILTIDHAKRAINALMGDRKKSVDKGMRVSIEDHEGKFIERPDDPERLHEYEAVQDFLYEILWRRATDVDMLAGKQKYRLVYNIDGVAIEQEDGLELETGERVFRFLKRAAGLDVEELRRPQKGRILAALLNHNGNPGHTEVHTSGTTAGERMRLKIQSGPAIFRLPDLGIAPPRLEALRELLGKSRGLLVISSTPHNGASATQYAILKSHDVYMHNIHALERRSMIDLDNITQQIYDGANTDVDYARMLQTVLRREPDIVLVADCDDRETVLVAAKAASEDRKIYLGMQAKDCFDTLARLLKYLDDPELLSRSLIGILNQRLVRKLCEECREAYKPDEKTLKKLNLPSEKIERFYRPPSEQRVDKKGREIVCSACQGTGYIGRIGVFELLIVDELIAKMIAHGSPLKAIKAQARKNKMYYLQEEGLLKVIDGTTSMNEVLRVLRTTE
ncbi:MAG: GspE/PulE family protein [Phycisphaerae bacterium]